MRNRQIPELTFKIAPRDKDLEWLLTKKDRLQQTWRQNRFGEKRLRKIMQACNLVYPSNIIEAGISIIISKYSKRRHGDSAGAISTTQPTVISLYVEKRDTQRTILSVLCHELIHSLMWSRYYFDNRRRPISFFADIFADELITTLLEESTVKSRLENIDFKWALDYACRETYERMRNLKRTKDYPKVISELKTFFADSQRSIRQGSDALKERERVLRDMLSPLPLTLEEPP